jgi:hypothetical protein
MTLKEAINIYYPGYASHRNITLKQWFEAREIVKENPKGIDVLSKEQPEKRAFDG